MIDPRIDDCTMTDPEPDECTMADPEADPGVDPVTGRCTVIDWLER